MSHLPRPDPSHCPLCGQANRCAVAAGLAPEGCWCMAQTIDRAALARVPDGARGLTCICPACGAPGAVGAPQPAAGLSAEGAADVTRPGGPSAPAAPPI